MGDKKEAKFHFKSELDVFKALQKYGRESAHKLSARTGIPATTVQSILKRIESRDIYRPGVIAQFDRFSEVPMAFLSFTNVHPMRLRQLQLRSPHLSQIRGFIHNDKDVMLIVMEEDKDKLTAFLFTLMELLEARPAAYITTPKIARFDLSIPDRVLNSIYGKLPDKRRSRK